jgi:hypothetical protein
MRPLEQFQRSLTESNLSQSIAAKRMQCCRECERIGRRHKLQSFRLRRQITNAANAGGNNGFARRHRFQERNREPLTQAGEDGDIAGAEPVGDVLAEMNEGHHIGNTPVGR